MHSSGFILGIANRYHRYRFAVEWQRHSCTGDSVAPAAAHHTSSFLGLFVPNSLTAPRPSLGSSGFRCTSSFWRPAGYRYIRPVLKPARPERLPDKVFVSPDYDILDCCVSHSLSLSYTQVHTSGGANSWSGRGSPYPALLTLLLFALERGSTPSTVSNSSLSESWPKTWQFALRSLARSHLRDSPGIIGRLSSRSLDPAAVLHLGPSVLFCPPDSPDVSSRASIPQELFLHRHVLPWWRLSCVVPLLHDGAPP
jgi:hypothetical protein